MGHLTQNEIQEARYDGSGGARCVLWDDKPHGLGLRIFPSGRKAFVLSYRDRGGSKRLATIGDFGTFTLSQARTAACEMLREAEQGADALAVRRAHKAAPTVADAVTMYLERHAIRKKSGAEDRRRLERHVLPRWSGRKLADITRMDVADLVRAVGEGRAPRGPAKTPDAARKASQRPRLSSKPVGRPYEANRTLALLSVLFTKAVGFGLLPAGHPNPCAGIDRYPERSRDRWLTPEEMPKLAAAIDALPNEYARAALWLYLLSGCRKGELLRAKWSDVDEHRAVLRLPVTKAGRSHEVPLTGPALAILQSLPRVADNPHVFPGRKKGAHLESVRAAWDRVRLAAGVEDARLHDLRRTVGSWLAQSGASLHLIGRVLNHSNVSTSAIYARFAQDHARDALEQHSARILGAAGKLPAAEVTSIAKARRGRK